MIDLLLAGLAVGSPASITKIDIDAALSGTMEIAHKMTICIKILIIIDLCFCYRQFTIGLLWFNINKMQYYTIQVKTRGEEKFIRLFNALHPDVRFSLHFPRRRIDIRRKGSVQQTTAAVFPGYIFIEAESEEIHAHQWAFRRTDGFYRFLKSNQDITPLAGKDLELVLHFIKKSGPVAGISKIFFNEDSRIIVVEGPLMGLEGRIIKVDKRKKRAKVKLNLYNDSFAIDLSFEVMGSLS